MILENIRNDKIKIFTNNLFPDIADKYDEEAILEAINNCIAHQDYYEGSRIIVYEKPDMLIFESVGSFLKEKLKITFKEQNLPKLSQLFSGK